MKFELTRTFAVIHATVLTFDSSGSDGLANFISQNRGRAFESFGTCDIVFKHVLGRHDASVHQRPQTAKLFQHSASVPPAQKTA